MDLCAAEARKTTRQRLGCLDSISPTVFTRHTPKNGFPFSPEAILGGFSFSRECVADDAIGTLHLERLCNEIAWKQPQ
jgi:hypothetical protein